MNASSRPPADPCNGRLEGGGAVDRQGTRRRNGGGLAAALMLFVALGASAAPAAGDAVAGQTVFRLCASCHAVGPSARAGFGPQLNAIFGRRAASTADFQYSQALQRSNIVWSDATLAPFLDDPTRAVPGTKMRFYGLSDSRKVADLFAYLRTFQPPTPPR